MRNPSFIHLLGHHMAHTDVPTTHKQVANKDVICSQFVVVNTNTNKTDKEVANKDLMCGGI